MREELPDKGGARMEYRTTPETPVRRDRTPWIWLLVVLLAIALVLVIWWAVAARGRERPMVTAPEEKERVEAEQPAVQPPPEQPLAEQPVVVEREQPVNIYVQPERPSMRVIIVPQGERPPQAKPRLRKVDLPGRLRYQGEAWEPSDEAFVQEAIDLKDTGASVDGNIVYVEEDAEPPYDALYLETQPGSGIYVQYEPVE